MKVMPNDPDMLEEYDFTNEEFILKALLVAGARPNFMENAPVYRAAQGYGNLAHLDFC